MRCMRGRWNLETRAEIGVWQAYSEGTYANWRARGVEFIGYVRVKYGTLSRHDCLFLQPTFLGDSHGQFQLQTLPGIAWCAVT